MRKMKNKRKNYLLEKKFQLKYVFLGIFMFIFTIVLVQMNVYNQLTKLLLQESRLTGISVILEKINVVFIGWFLVGTLIIGAAGIYLSHRLIGPLKRLERLMADVEQGYLPAEMKIRKKDEFKEINHAFNKMMVNLKVLLSNDKILLKEIHGELHTVLEVIKQDHVPAGAKNELKEQIEHISQKTEKVLSAFKM